MEDRTKGRNVDKNGNRAVFIKSREFCRGVKVLTEQQKNDKRMWRNWQTRRFQVPVGNSVWVQIPSSAPHKENDSAVIVRNPWKIQGFLHVEKRDIFLQKYCCKMAILGF